MPPQRTDAFEYYALARLRSARQHELRRALAQGGGDGGPGGEQRDADAEPGCKPGEPRIDGQRERQLGHEEYDAVGLHDDGGQHLGQREDAQNAADPAGRGCVCEVFGGDARATVAKRLERADEGTLLLHHARHGGEGHESRHEEEDEREHRGDAVHAVGVRLEAGCTVVRRAVHDQPFGALQIVDLLLGVVEATLGVRQLRIGVGFLLLVFGEAAVVVGATLFELGAAVLQPSGGVVELLLSRGDLRVGLRAR